MKFIIGGWNDIERVVRASLKTGWTQPLHPWTGLPIVGRHGKDRNPGVRAAQPAKGRTHPTDQGSPTDSNDDTRRDAKMKFNSTILVAALTALTFAAPACDKKDDKKDDKKGDEKKTDGKEEAKKTDEKPVEAPPEEKPEAAPEAAPEEAAAPEAAPEAAPAE